MILWICISFWILNSLGFASVVEDLLLYFVRLYVIVQLWFSFDMGGFR
jgi:hypothetical protein